MGMASDNDQPDVAFGVSLRLSMDIDSAVAILLAAFGSLLKQKMYEQELADSVKNMFALAKRCHS